MERWFRKSFAVLENFFQSTLNWELDRSRDPEHHD